MREVGAAAVVSSAMVSSWMHLRLRSSAHIRPIWNSKWFHLAWAT